MKSATAEEADSPCKVLSVTPIGPLPVVSTAHRDLSKCPCDQSKSSWKIDCSKCKQFWHVNCLGLNGLNEKSYNKLAEYLCPFCYVAPIPTLPSEVDVCHICRNTLALQQSNSLQEISLASSKMKSMETFCETVKNIDFDSLATQLGTIESLNLHLQHLLIDKESLKENQERLLRVDGTVSGLDNQISQLQEQVSELLNRPEPEITGPSSSTDELLAVISSKLNQISTEEPLISVELASLKSSVDALEKTASAVSQFPQNRVAAEVPSELPSSAKLYAHEQLPVESSSEDFITAELENELCQTFESIKDEFKLEGSRSVLYYGEKYQYTGARSSVRDSPIPPSIASLMDRINNELCTGDKPSVNSCLVNRFEGSESYLPQHSDNEPTIHPESNIITLSLGSECTLTFSNKGSENSVLQHLSSSRSIYSMTRKSQEIYDHRIDQGSVANGIRFSLTFRSISRLNRNATCIVGDSNTAGLKFGSDPKRSFGKSLPGKRFPATLLDDINPYDCNGYSNVVVMCGINNIKSDNIKTPANIRGVYNGLVAKIVQIQSINPKAHVFVCPVLPTKLTELNRKGICFNNMIMNELLPSNFGVTFVDGFQEFLDENGLLSRELSREFNRFKRPDFLHLNWGGLAKLGCLIRNTVILRRSGGVDRRTRTRVDGTSYRDVAASRVEQHDGYQPS